MHILIIPSSRFMTESEPHSAIFQWHQAKAFKKEGYDVGILSVGYITLRYFFKKYYYKNVEKKDGVNIYRKYNFLFFPHRYIPFLLSKFMHIKKGLNYFKSYVKQYGKPDIIHAHNFLFGGFIAQAINKKYGIKYIITEHSSAYYYEEIPESLDNQIIQCALESNCVTAVSSNFAIFLQERFHINVQVLPNIIDEIFFINNFESSKMNRFTFLNIASMETNKNQELILRAFAKKFKGTHCELKIGGIGPLKRRLLELSKEMNIELQVKFLGSLNQAQVKQEMRNANCFILSSNYETFGVVLIEALACKTPVIATKCGGPEDIVNDTNGILVNVKSLGEMASAMESMYINEKKYDGNNISQDIKNKFGADAFLQKVLKLYGIDKM